MNGHLECNGSQTSVEKRLDGSLYNHDIVCPYDFPHLLASKDARHW